LGWYSVGTYSDYDIFQSIELSINDHVRYQRLIDHQAAADTSFGARMPGTSTIKSTFLLTVSISSTLFTWKSREQKIREGKMIAADYKRNTRTWRNGSVGDVLMVK
jgi:hypothetical protein